jgi:hypothetical protein
MVNPSRIAASQTELVLSDSVAQGLASALKHLAAWSKQLDALKQHLFEGQAYNSNREWFGVNVRTPLILDKEEIRLLYALLLDVAEIGERAQGLLARLENQDSSPNHG